MTETTKSLRPPNLLPVGRIQYRLLALIALVFCELLSVSLAFDANLPRFSESGLWYTFLAYTGNLAEIIVVFFAALMLPIWGKRDHYLQRFKSNLASYKFHRYLIAQLLVFIAFFLCSSLVFGDIFSPANFPDYLILLWIFLALVLAALSFLSIAPLNFWQDFIRAEKMALIFATLVGLTAWSLAEFSQSLWNPLSDITFTATSLLLDFFYPEIFVDVSRKLLGTADFIVNIAPQCSGYEGMGLVIIFTSAYLYIFKKEFRFPQVLILFPIGLVTIWCFNILRIVLLIAIGSSYSVQIAVGGFHSQAGWIAFLLVIFAMLIAAHKIRYFSASPIQIHQTHQTQTTFPVPSAGQAPALLLPFIVLMASIIFSTTFSGDFVWLYPLRVIAVGAVLVWFWKVYQLKSPPKFLQPAAAGLLVYVIWLLLVPADPVLNNEFSEELAAVSAQIAVPWLIFRFLGAVITIPLAEELLFRGYLLSRLSKQEISLEGPLKFSWFGLVATSILFGLLHSNILAGTLAGLVYGAVRFRGSSILDAVLAHAVTNLLLSITVIVTGNWSIW